MSRTVAIVQARLGSTRLPGKVLADICGRPMLEHLLRRVARAPVDQIVVATTDLPEDDRLADWIVANGIATCFRGSATDVLSRFQGAAEQSRADTIVRVTADDPLKDPSIIAHALALLAAQPSLDYCSNTMQPSYPEGLDIEVFSAKALQRAHQQAQLPSEREHVTPYIWKNTQLFHALNFSYKRPLSHWRWTVDKPEDLQFMRAVFSAFDGDSFVPFEQVIAYIDQHPEVAQINAGTVRNEGYLQSLQTDQL